MPHPTNAVFCTHANEVPSGPCPCDPSCYRHQPGDTCNRSPEARMSTTRKGKVIRGWMTTTHFRGNDCVVVRTSRSGKKVLEVVAGVKHVVPVIITVVAPTPRRVPTTTNKKRKGHK